MQKLFTWKFSHIYHHHSTPLFLLPSLRRNGERRSRRKNLKPQMSCRLGSSCCSFALAFFLVSDALSTPQTSNTVYEIVSDMSTRQDALEEKLACLEDKLQGLQVSIGRRHWSSSETATDVAPTIESVESKFRSAQILICNIESSHLTPLSPCRIDTSAHRMRRLFSIFIRDKIPRRSARMTFFVSLLVPLGGKINSVWELFSERWNR